MEELNKAQPCPCEGACEACGGCAPEEKKTNAVPVTVVSVRFREDGKDYSFSPDKLQINVGDAVIVDTARGEDFGVCSAGKHDVPESEIVQPLRKVLRLATDKDRRRREENIALEKEAFGVCQKKIEEMKLDMQLVSTECVFDGSKLLFFFTADERVDFRELVKSLASSFHMRIELRQIGVRDKAKMVGGLGICGRPFCCKAFLDDFQPVSIKMAKTQNLSLNPTKISGTCGRLMCCLKYEQDAYEDLIKTVPKPDSFVDTPSGRGTVTDINLLRQSVRVQLEKSPDTFVTCKVADIYVIRNGKAKKTDEPIPADFAPISGAPKKAAVPKDAPMPELRFRSKKSDAPMEGAPSEPEEKKNENPRRRRHRGHRGGEGNKPKEGV